MPRRRLKRSNEGDYVVRKCQIRHKGQTLRTVSDRITMQSALAELGDAESNLGRLRAGATLKRQRRVGRTCPMYVRFTYTAENKIGEDLYVVRASEVMDPAIFKGGAPAL